MIKEHDLPKEPARSKAERRWKNANLSKRLKEAQQRKPRLVTDDEPEIAQTITNDGRRDGPINRFESKFIKEIRAIIDEVRDNNLKYYKAAIERRRYLLLKEKLRRLQAAQQSQGGTNV